MRVYSLLLIVSIFIFCATNKSIKTTQVSGPTPSENFFLPGLDSSVVKSAVQFSDRLIVDYKRRELADRLYQKGMNSFRTVESLWSYIHNEKKEDSSFIQIYENWLQMHDASLQSSRLIEEIKPDKLDHVCLAVLDSAYKEISQAKSYNPFDLEIRSLLIKIYLKQGEISRDKVYFTRSIEELKNFLLVDKSNPYIYEKLGECFYALNEWENSYRFFHDAEKILKIVSKFKYEADPIEAAPFDTIRWIYYLRRQGEAKARLYDSESAIHFLTQAKELSKSNKTKQELQDILNWIDWDGGNIRAAEIRDEILKIENSNDYKKARAEYLELAKILRTLRAKNEINWKIASIEYNILGRKKEALRRLFQVVQTIRNSNQISPLNVVYLKDYAAMCYSIGMEYFNKNNYRLAYIFLNQASQIDWNHKGECYFQLAILTRENPTETIRNCNNALNHADQLSKTKINAIYEMLAVSYKRKGEFNIADRYFQNWIDQKNVIKN